MWLNGHISEDAVNNTFYQMLQLYLRLLDLWIDTSAYEISPQKCTLETVKCR